METMMILFGVGFVCGIVTHKMIVSWINSMETALRAKLLAEMNKTTTQV